MKTVYTVPKLSSLSDNGIKDLFSVAEYPTQLRLIQLTGTPVRIEINKNYVEINCEDESINLSAYNEMFKGLMEFFYGTAYLYGCVNDDKLIVYDVFTNDNYFSTKDMGFLERTYNVPIVTPLAEGNFEPAEIIATMHQLVIGKEIPMDEIHILPTVYVVDNREYETFKPEMFTKIIYGEKKSYSSTTTTTAVATTTTKTEPKKIDLKELEVFELVTKAERTSIYNETMKNVSAYFETIKDKLPQACIDWWKKNGLVLTYVYAIHTLPKTRNLIYEYAASYILPSEYLKKPVEDKWAAVFLDMIDDKYYNTELLRRFIATLNNYDYFAMIFKQELLILNSFYEKEMKDEIEKWGDWRDGFGYSSLGEDWYGYCGGMI